MPSPLNQQIAKLLRDAYFGGNWTGSNYRDQLRDVSWIQATTVVNSFHTLAELVFHANYYVDATIKFFREGVLEASDSVSFEMPKIESKEDWDSLMEKCFADAEALASIIEEMPETQLWETFAEERYGTYHRCLHGPIEHSYYHLGQIAMIKSMISDGEETAVG